MILRSIPIFSANLVTIEKKKIYCASFWTFWTPITQTRNMIFLSHLQFQYIANLLSIWFFFLKDQLDVNVIEQIDYVTVFASNSFDCKFSSNMPVFKPSSNTTKGRVVYLLNISEKDRLEKPSLSNNKSMVSGQQLNQPIAISLTLLRFDQNLMVYDLQNVFLQLKLSSTD